MCREEERGFSGWIFGVVELRLMLLNPDQFQDPCCRIIFSRGLSVTGEEIKTATRMIITVGGVPCWNEGRYALLGIAGWFLW